ncbi:hypothetical protein GCM10007981_05830 [Thermocladium modestius]|uniref:Uncharacterized protein n=1 Tax=Thermocladium modestius TaxID=62609 RepID=A0A830GWZ3_9CREN|nr:hypothetical protein [Thermocladium modestius]GGP19968.1 hypothetical protein GCM10007981_05830 [Thermocladium modestius]
MDVFDAAKWREAVKLINYGYGGLMIGLLAWLTYLIAGHYTFGTNINPLINATTIAVVATVVFVGVNVAYETIIQPIDKKRGKTTGKGGAGKSKGKTR